jgi:L-ascorbate metabolism protein UlaG (beta-lactamase superfamily)
MKKAYAFILTLALALTFASCSGAPAETAKLVPPAQTPAQAIAPAAAAGKPTLTYFGQSSMKIKTSKGTVVYIDPYAPGDYSEKADVILVSHEHQDHNKIDLVAQKTGCKVLRVVDTINADNSYNNFTVVDVKIEPVPAANKNHPIGSTNGYILNFDGVVVYHASDTSKLDSMASLKARSIDYAFFPIDGQYNMGPAEATESAKLVGAKRNIPFHIGKSEVKDFKADNVLVLTSGQTIELVAAKKP